MHKILFYIPIYNGKKYIMGAIHSIIGQTKKVQEFLIIDDGSTDGTAECIDYMSVPFMRVITHKDNKGIGAARNSALSVSEDGFIASIDCDCVADLDWLERCMEQFTQPHIAGVGGRLCEDDVRSGPDMWRKKHLPQTSGEEKREVPFLPGCNTVYRISALKEVGGYEATCRRHHEDTAIGQKLRAAGYILIYEPKAGVRHKKNDTLLSLMRSAWGFRNATIPVSFFDVYLRSMRDGFHAIKTFVKDVVDREWVCAGIDIVYPWYQVWFSFRAWKERAWPL